MKNWLALVLATLLLAGCSGKEIPDSWISIIESEAAIAPEPPPECSPKVDPKWRTPPKGAELAADTARREQANKSAFRELAGRRRVCAAGLTAEHQGIAGGVADLVVADRAVGG